MTTFEICRPGNFILYVTVCYISHNSRTRIARTAVPIDRQHSKSAVQTISYQLAATLKKHDIFCPGTGKFRVNAQHPKICCQGHFY